MKTQQHAKMGNFLESQDNEMSKGFRNPAPWKRNQNVKNMIY